MCHLSMKLSGTFDQNPPYTFDKIREKVIPMKKNGLTLRAKFKVIAKIKSQCPGKQKTYLPKQFEQGFPGRLLRINICLGIFNLRKFVTNEIS